jgi:hypothetical protein
MDYHSKPTYSKPSSRLVRYALNGVVEPHRKQKGFETKRFRYGSVVFSFCFAASPGQCLDHMKLSFSWGCAAPHTLPSSHFDRTPIFIRASVHVCKVVYLCFCVAFVSFGSSDYRWGQQLLSIPYAHAPQANVSFGWWPPLGEFRDFQIALNQKMPRRILRGARRRSRQSASN